MKAEDHSEETIAAIATPPGPGGIGIIRLSGGSALEILRSFFKPHKPSPRFVSHRMYYGTILNPRTRNPIDEVLAVYMASPHTYTREDVVEIHCHGSFLILQDVLALMLQHPGIRLADPGEFTKRAFLNGRIDLTQAEAVAELLQARTREGLNLAVAQLQGGLFERIKRIRDILLEVRAIIEVAIDFPDDEVEIIHPERMAAQVRTGVKMPLEELMVLSRKGKIFREGISVVILGRPNVGKSSLLNSLLQEERAIVTEIPGTTRDTIEELLDVKGIPVRIIDTAGVREAAEAIEEFGIIRTRRKMAEADLVILVVDAAAGIVPQDLQLAESIAEKPAVVVVNKIDIAKDGSLEEFRQAFGDRQLMAISAKNHTGIGELEETIFEMVTGNTEHWDPGYTCVPNVRHEASLRRAQAATTRILGGLDRELTPDLLAIELQSALDHLGDIVGETTTDDVLDMIFEQFCIGK